MQITFSHLFHFISCDFSPLSPPLILNIKNVFQHSNLDLEQAALYNDSYTISYYVLT